jgi:uncharacterized protein (DUF3820 family)
MTAAADKREREAEPPDIVPQALQYRLGWDELHDAVAAQIIAEFSLILPRDQELIRQLAFLRIAQSEIVSFGKYRGWLIEDVIEGDPQYLEWLASQPDFRERHPRLCQIIIENDLGPEDVSEPKVSREDEFIEWQRDNPPPDLQVLVAKHGGYHCIPQQAWDEYDKAMIDWQTRRRARFCPEKIPSDDTASPFECRTCGDPARFGYTDRASGEMRWYCAKHRLGQRWADATAGAAP